MSQLLSAAREALAVVFPISCAGCDLPDVGWCPACADRLSRAPVEQVLDDGIPVVSAAVFEGPVARAIRAFKQDGRVGLARPLGRALARVCASDAVAVPVPSSRAALRRRGYDTAALLARRGGLRPASALVSVRRVADQRQLGRDDREVNVAHSFRARDVAGWRVIVVDDVVTSGATIREAARALRAAGAEVVGAATVAATPLRMRDPPQIHA